MVNLLRLTVKSKTILKRAGIFIPTSEFLWVRNSPVDYEQCKWIYERPYIRTVATDTKILRHTTWVRIPRSGLKAGINFTTAYLACTRLRWSIISSYLFLYIYFSLFLSTFLYSNLLFSTSSFLKSHFIAELQRAKRASEAPWVRKIGNPSSRENLVMTSAYERASERPYRLGGRERGVSRYSSPSPIRETKECHLSLAVFGLEKSEEHSFLFAMSTNDRSAWSKVSR